MIVAKFGGTSVADAAAIRRVAEIAALRQPERPVIVASALAGVTDALIALARAAEVGDGEEVRSLLEGLSRRHESVGLELPGVEDALRAIHEDLDVLSAEVEGAMGSRPQPADLDQIVGRGELWSSHLVAAAMEGSGLTPAWVDIRPLMLTDDRFGRATPDQEGLALRARECLVPLLDAGAIPVTQGFIGATHDGRPTTLGRGGSDFTAALLGAALGAERVEIWTDVDGLMTADPRIVPSARTLRVASYEEAAELATFGAKVLHPATAMPLVRAGIPIVVLNSNHPDRVGTTITPSAELERLGDSPVRSISWKKDVTLVNVRALPHGGRRLPSRAGRPRAAEAGRSLGRPPPRDHRRRRHRHPAHPRPCRAPLPGRPAGQRRGDLPGRVRDQHDVRGPRRGRPWRRPPASLGVLWDRVTFIHMGYSHGGIFTASQKVTTKARRTRRKEFVGVLFTLVSSSCPSCPSCLRGEHSRDVHAPDDSG
jgi:aspartate kinase